MLFSCLSESSIDAASDDVIRWKHAAAHHEAAAASAAASAAAAAAATSDLQRQLASMRDAYTSIFFTR